IRSGKRRSARQVYQYRSEEDVVNGQSEIGSIAKRTMRPRRYLGGQRVACTVAISLLVSANALAAIQLSSPKATSEKAKPLPLDAVANARYVAYFQASPDGQTAAYVYWDSKDGKNHAVMVDIASGRESALGSKADETLGPTFAPDGKTVVFFSQT